jgi:hypothetical protein
VEDPQHSADDGESKRNQEVKRAENKRINEDYFKGLPHKLVTPFKLLKTVGG